jgi:hypothetical protein
VPGVLSEILRQDFKAKKIIMLAGFEISDENNPHDLEKLIN